MNKKEQVVLDELFGEETIERLYALISRDRAVVPKYHKKGINRFNCPICKEVLDFSVDESFCFNCGQRLNWDAIPVEKKQD